MAIKEKSIRARINELKEKQGVSFPLSRYDYVVSCRTRLQTTTGKQFTSSIDNKRGVVVITREK